MPTSLPTAHPPKGYIRLAGSERRVSEGAKFLGPAEEAEIVQLTIVLRRHSDGPPLPDFDYYGNTPPNKREKFTAEDFAGKYGAHPDDIQQVVSFVETSGLTVESISAGERAVRVSGSVARMTEAFAVPMGRFEVTTKQGRKPKAPPKKVVYRGRDGFIHIPEAIAPLLIGVFGLDNRNITRRFTQAGDPTFTQPITIPQITELYKFPSPVPAISNQTIGIVAMAGGYALPDLQAYFNSIGVKMPTIHQVSIDGTEGALAFRTIAELLPWQNTLTFASTEGINAGDEGTIVVEGTSYFIWVLAVHAKTITIAVWSPTLFQYTETGFGVNVPTGTWIYFNVDSEVTQDICIAGSAAPGASITVYYADNSQAGWVGLIGKALDYYQEGFREPTFRRPSVVSSSFGIGCGDDIESQIGCHVWASFLTAVDMAFQDAAAQHVTVCCASGDSGSMFRTDFNHVHVYFPASDPWVLAVGGTTVGISRPGRPGGQPAWVEFVWNEIKKIVDLEFIEFVEFATGGGVSAFFSLPSYQKNAKVPDSLNPTGFGFPKTGRGVPDVAANASIFGGYPITVAGLPVIANGTSAAAPLWAALIAMINANLGYDVGFVNSFLYTLGPDAFNPINPLWPDPDYPQLTDCPASNGINGNIGYPAGQGWDACTGWGSPNGTVILNAFKSA